MVTCGTHLKRHHFEGSEHLRLLCKALRRFAWNLQAWLFSPTTITGWGCHHVTLPRCEPFVSERHTETSTVLNEADCTWGRQA
jgi:hypothetical protein